MAAKNSVNLLQPELYPETPLITLTNVMITWCVLLFVMVGWSVITEMNFKQSAQQYDALLQEKQDKSRQAESLLTALQSREASPALTNDLLALKLVMQHKNALLKKLTDPNETFAGGFVMAMNDLAAMHHKDIRLQSININSADMSFSGIARNPKAVPAWLAGFKDSRLLSGKAFAQFKLSQNEQGITEFVVSSMTKKGGS